MCNSVVGSVQKIHFYFSFKTNKMFTEYCTLRVYQVKVTRNAAVSVSAVSALQSGDKYWSGAGAGRP